MTRLRTLWLVAALGVASCVAHAWAQSSDPSSRAPDEAAPPAFPTRAEVRAAHAEYRSGGGTESLAPRSVHCPGETLPPRVDCMSATVAALRYETREVRGTSPAREPRDGTPTVCPPLTYVMSESRGPLPDSGNPTVAVFAPKDTTRARRDDRATCCYHSQPVCPWRPRPNE